MQKERLDSNHLNSKDHLCVVLWIIERSSKDIMNVSPNVDRSSAPFTSLGEVTDRMVSSLASDRSASDDLNKSASPEGDGDLKKFSGGIESSKALSLDKPSPLPEEKGKKDPPATVKVEHNPSGDKSEQKKRRARKKWKKPKDKPNRPLSAYNLFFQAERATMLGDDAKVHDQDKGKKRVHRKTHGKIGFAEMARAIGQKWKDLPDDQKKQYLEQAATEKKRYAVELKAWKEEQKLKPKTGKSLLAALKAESRASERDGASSVGATESSANVSETLKLQMMAEELKVAEEIKQRNMALLQQRSDAEYLRALQERQMALLAGRPSLDTGVFQYPSAAEASANAILQQFQYSMPGSLGGVSGLNQRAMNMNMTPMGMNSMNMNSLGTRNMMVPVDFQQIGGLQSQFGTSNRLHQLRGGLGAGIGDFQAMGSLSMGSATGSNNSMIGAGQGDLGRLEQLANSEMAAAMARRLQNRFNM